MMAYIYPYAKYVFKDADEDDNAVSTYTHSVRVGQLFEIYGQPLMR